MPVLSYRRVASTNGLYVVPNVYREHAVYLHYISAFYHELPRTSFFLHGHHTSWHNRRPAHEQIQLRP